MTDSILVGTRKGLFTVRRGGGRWRVASSAFLGDPVTIALRDWRDGSLHVGLDTGHFGVKYRRSRDDGASWEDVRPPQYPPKPDDPTDVDPFRKQPVPWSTLAMWELAVGGDDEPGVLWCGTIPGGLFRSGDSGDTWQLIESLWNRPERRKWSGGGFDFAGIHSVCVDPRDRRHVVVGVSVGGVWSSRDGGETWTNTSVGMRAEYVPPEDSGDVDVQDPHRVVMCAGQPDVFWVQHHNGIFRSTNGATTWTEIEGVQPSVFGFAVVVHPSDPDSAWFVPAQKDECRVAVDGQVAVTRTRDGGRSFEQLREGLPQEHAYDLTFRHALDVDETGEVLAFGSTTGSLWVSEDSGDHWQHVCGHLPPIRCVRFG